MLNGTWAENLRLRRGVPNMLAAKTYVNLEKSIEHSTEMRRVWREMQAKPPLSRRAGAQLPTRSWEWG